MRNGDVCPICEAGSLSLSSYVDHFNHRSSSVEVKDLIGWVCGACGERTIDSAQIKSNQKKIAIAKREFADLSRPRELLASTQIRALRVSLGFTQSEASRVFRGGRNAFSKYERGETIQSEPMDLLLRLAADVPEATLWLCEKAGLSIRTEKNVTITGSPTWVSNVCGVAGHIESMEIPRTAVNEDMVFTSEWRNAPQTRVAL